MSYDGAHRRKRKGLVGGIAFGVILILAVILTAMSVKRIPAGYVGVVYNINGGIEGETLSQGWRFVGPTKKVTTYSVGLEQSYLSSQDIGDSPNDDSFSIPTSDGKTVKVSLEFSYWFDPERVSQTFTMFKGQNGKTVKDTFIKPKIMAWTQEVSATYPVTDIFGDKRTEINQELDRYLKEKFNPYGIIIDTVNFTDINVDDQTMAAIQKKVNAQQELELARIEAQTAEIQANKDKEVALIDAQKSKEVAMINAENQREVARVNAEQAKIKADADAQVVKIAADAEASANRTVAASLTTELLEKLKYEQWNGSVPQVEGGNSTPIVDIRP
jgi:regulator of protease activity HflC (stomatin/prohibitin superfamily)